jgi:nitroimidazol reductase NimA-like FMN-containing flavoprotein (pyridoxamine 5'-phosphate oxidase superfamily)
MRRSSQAIVDRDSLDRIIHQCKYCSLALCDGDRPYVVPVSFGYDGERVFIHSATEGRKVDLLRRNPSVTLLFTLTGELRTQGPVCSWGMAYESVVITGTARELVQADEKQRALDCIVAQYGDGVTTGHYAPGVLARTLVVAVEIQEIVGKRG